MSVNCVDLFFIFIYYFLNFEIFFENHILYEKVISIKIIIIIINVLQLSSSTLIAPHSLFRRARALLSNVPFFFFFLLFFPRLNAQLFTGRTCYLTRVRLLCFGSRSLLELRQKFDCSVVKSDGWGERSSKFRVQQQ